MSDQTVYPDDDFLDGCAIDFNLYADDEETQELRALFPDGNAEAEIEWRALFREEDLDEIEERLLGVMAEDAIRGAGAYSGDGRDLGIAARLRAMGLKVVEIAGWQTRGSATFHPKGSVDHHTASAKGSNAPALGICTNGRTDLPGPLCHVLIGRDNTCYVIASGRANHAGTGSEWGITGNSNVYGVERENTGTGTEPWREDQRVTAAKVHAALLQGIAPQYRRVCEHRDWAPDRKIDAWNQTKEDLQRRVDSALNATPAGGLFMALTAAEEKEILDGIRSLSKGAPMYGIPATPIGIARILFHLEGQVVDNITEKPIKKELMDRMAADQKALLAAINALPNKIVAALPAAAAGGLSMEDVRGAVRTEIVTIFGPIFTGIGDAP